MWLFKLAWKNLWRNKGRTIITMAAIYFAVILSVIADSLTHGVFDNLIKNVVSFYSGYLQVHKKGYWNNQILDNSFEANTEAVQKMRGLHTITAVTPRLESFALASSGAASKGCMVSGIDPDSEDRVTQLSTKIIRGQFLHHSDNAVLLGEGLAERLQLDTGDTIVLIGQGFHGALAAGKYPIQGILSFGAPQLNDGVLFMPLKAAQDLFSAYGRITAYAIALDNPGQITLVQKIVTSVLPADMEVLTWGDMMPEVKQHIQSDTNSMKYIQFFLYLLISFGIFGTLLMMMVERKFELGMLVAIGMKKTILGTLVAMELLLTVLAGCIAGILTAIPVVLYLKIHPIRFGGETAAAYERFGFEPVFPASDRPEIFLTQAAIVFIAGALLSLYPVFKIAGLNAVQSMKK